MMKRHQQILVGILIIQIALSILVFWPRSVSSGAGVAVFADIKPEEIVDFRLTDDQGLMLHLAKVDGNWVLPEAGDFPAQADKLNPILEKLVKLTTGNLVARTEASHRALQVADDAFVRRLEFSTTGGASYTLYLGSAPRYSATHFRVAGSPETYLTTELATWELMARQSYWIDTAYISIDQDTLSKVTLENAQGRFVFVRDADNAWTLEDLRQDETISAGNVGGIVRNATSMSIQTVLGKVEEPEYGMSTPSAKVTLETNDGAVKVLVVGAKNEADTTYVVKFSESEYYARAVAYLVQAMVENSRENFLVAPSPTPTPAP